MPERVTGKTEEELEPLFAWLGEFHTRSEHFDTDSVPLRIWDLLLRAMALKTALAGDCCSVAFRSSATNNLLRFVGELKLWDATLGSTLGELPARC